jgi:hypothetical protein
LDDEPLGVTPIAPLTVSAGVHSLKFEHPDYQPILRKITAKSGESMRVQIDFTVVGVPKPAP